MMVLCREHAGLHDVGADVGQHGLKLLANHVRRHRLNAVTRRVFWAVIAVMTEQP